MKNKPKNHHYIPQFLIREFATNPNSNKKNRTVFVLHKWTKEIEKIKIPEICSVDNFNTYAQEKQLSRMESDIFAPSLQNYLDGKHDISDIQTLKYFASILLCSTPYFRKNLIRTLTAHMDNQWGFSTGSVNVFDDFKGKFDWTEKCANAVFSEIEGWNCVSLTNDTPVFITSNSPVKVNNRENGYFEINLKNFEKPKNIEEHEDIISFNLGFKIANADLKTDPWIHFPISPNHVIIFAPTPDILSKIKLSIDSIQEKDLNKVINTYTFGFSEDYAFSSKIDLLEEVKPLINFRTESNN